MPCLHDSRMAMKTFILKNLPYKEARTQYEATTRLTKADKLPLKDFGAKVEDALQKKPEPLPINMHRILEKMKVVKQQIQKMHDQAGGAERRNWKDTNTKECQQIEGVKKDIKN